MNATSPRLSDRLRLHYGTAGLYFSWTLFLSVQLFSHSILGSELASWDGYERSAWASTIWYDLRHFDLYLLWKHTHEQVVWPPLHSWVTGVLFVLFGASLETARMLCLGSLAFSSWLLFRYFSPQQSGSVFAAITAWLLFSTSPFIVHHATSIMSELPGLCLVYAVLAFLPKEEEHRPSFVTSGVLLGMLFLYKYNYAGLTFAGLLFSRWIHSGFAIRGFFTPSHLQLFGIPLLMVFFWFLPELENKVSGFRYFATNNPNARMPLNWESILLYPLQLPEVYFAAPWVCYASAAVMATAFFLHPLRFLRHPVFTLFWVHFLAAVLHPMKDIRFVFIPMGMWFLFTGISLQWILQRFTAFHSRFGKSLLFASLTALSLTAMTLQYPLYTQPHLSMENRHEGVIHNLTHFIQPEDYVGLFISHDLFMPPAINFYFNTMMDTVSRRSYNQPQRWSFYFLLQPRDRLTEQSMEAAVKSLRHEFFLRRTNKIIVLQSTAPEKITNFNLWYGGADEMSQVLNHIPEVHLIQEHHYPDIDLVTKLYRVQ